MKVCVIGAGASGLISAIAAASASHQVIVLEHNEKAGKKIYITGKGRCNLTNLCDSQEFLSNVVSNPKFLYSAIKKYPPKYIYDYFNDYLKLPLKTERGNRVFPVSDKASDVTSALVRELTRQNGKILYNTEVKSFNIVDNRIVSLNTMTDIVLCDAVILATGGLSYSQTGSDGSGYKLAKSVGHGIVEPKPSLVDILAEDCNSLQGLSLKNVSASLVSDKGETVAEQFGEMLFTENGLSGPIILTLSAYASRLNLVGSKIVINLKPALSQEQLDARLLRDFEEFKNKEIKNCLLKLLPERLVCFIIDRCGIDPNTKVNIVNRAQRSKIVHEVQNLAFKVVSLGDFSRAVITSGGVKTSEINPTTMKSKLIDNLYFAGEIIDVDALTGGFNLQIAFCTGLVAGNIGE